MSEKYRAFEQDGVTYNLYEMPSGFVIKGDLDLAVEGLTELPDLSEVTVEGDFSCANNKLTSLKGCPRVVGGDFDCSHNKLTSLEGAPRKVGGGFGCWDNNLVNLGGAPQEVGENFMCHANNLESLYGMPALKNGKVQCDAAVGEKYGFAASIIRTGASIFTDTELRISPTYQNEAKIDELRQKQQQEQVEKRAKAMRDTKAAFEAWLKKNGTGKNVPEK